ncbi:PH domain-containing protein [Rhodococcus tibetensis]|uniref:PH domain-containing protein n=1 Tax=Rhodococcus tibetensis TaxID=2965064 RepID=A0ABT1QB66_9NOCA|nr:PH domain-containing protein [Rhodococcus sp. FXJ9.536]MCQ4119508.1 PH domain-containing protein [Rhodococcus sp. FXJ9.536]
MTEDAPLQWSTPLTAVVALAVGGVALGAAGLVVSTEPAGRLLVSLAALGLLLTAASAGRQRPRLAVDREAGRIVVSRLSGRRTYARSDIERARIVRYPRLGRRVPMLEIDVRTPDGTERLLIFGRWDLGTNPEDVFDALSVHRLVGPQPRQ